MFKYLFFIAITVAVLAANAAVDVSFITVDGKPTVEVVVNGKVCHYSTTHKELTADPEAVVAGALRKCHPLK